MHTYRRMSFSMGCVGIREYATCQRSLGGVSPHVHIPDKFHLSDYFVESIEIFAEQQVQVLVYLTDFWTPSTSSNVLCSTGNFVSLTVKEVGG